MSIKKVVESGPRQIDVSSRKLFCHFWFRKFVGKHKQPPSLSDTGEIPTIGCIGRRSGNLELIVKLHLARGWHCQQLPRDAADKREVSPEPHPGATQSGVTPSRGRCPFFQPAGNLPRGPVGDRSNSDLLTRGLDFFDRVKLARPTPGADLAGRLPGLFGAKIGRPERPGPALPWPGVVHRAFSRFAIQQYAIAVRKFPQALANADPTHKHFLEDLDVGHASQFGDGGNFFIGYPHIARRARTAVTALRARKS